MRGFKDMLEHKKRIVNTALLLVLAVAAAVGSFPSVQTVFDKMGKAPKISIGIGERQPNEISFDLP